MAANIGAKISVEGEREYRQAISNINQQTKELNSEMTLLESSFTKTTSAEERAAAKSSVLEKQIANQSDKVSVLSERYSKQQSELDRLKAEMERTAKEYGENSTEAQKAAKEYQSFANQTSKTKTELNKAQADLNKMTHELEAAQNPTEEEGKELGKVSENLDKAGEKGLSFGDILKANVVSDVIIGGVKALGQAISGIAKGLVTTVTDTVKWADELNTLSLQTGISNERLQEMEYMAGLIDVDVNTIAGSMAKMTRNVSSAAKGTGDAAAAFETLGVSIFDANGNLRDSEEIFNDSIDALGNMENETERDAIAMKIFGRSAMELNPLIKAGSETLAEYANEAHEVGYVLDDEMIDSLNETSDALDRIKNAAESTKRRLVAAFAPTIANALESLTPSLVEMGESLTDLVGPAVDALKDGIEWVTDALGKMDSKTKETVGRFATLLIALGPTVPLLSSIANIAKVAAGAIGALVSNPVVLAITAGAVAIGGVALAIASVEAQHRAEVEAAAAAASEISRYTEAEQELINTEYNVVEAMTASRAATDEAVSSIMFQKDRAGELIEKLKELTDENGNVSESNQAQAQVIIDELNEAYGLEIKMIDGQIEEYDKLEESIYDVINAKTAEALLDRRRDDYLTALEEEQGLLDAIETAHNNAAEAQQNYNEQTALAKRLWQQYYDTAWELTAAETDALYEQIQAAETAAATAHTNWMNAVADESTFNRQYLENSRLIQNYDAAQIAAQRGNTQEVIDLMTGRANAWHDYGDAVDAATAQALDDMYDEVIAAAEYAAEVRTNWENGVEGYTESMVTEAENAYKSMLGKFESAYNDAYDVGFDFMTGLDNGLNSQLNQLKNTADSIAGVIPHGMRDVLDMHSPSRVAEEIGALFGEGLVKGLDSTDRIVDTAAERQADTMVDAFAMTNSLMSAMHSTGRLLAGGVSSNAVNYGGVNITVNASDEMTAREIADAVMEEMQRAVSRREAVYA